jgi:hypothetical protein
VTSRTGTIFLPQTTNTNCNGTGINNRPMTTASVNCQSSTNGGPSTITTRRLDVENIVESNGVRYKIVCTGSWAGTNCSPMENGEEFDADYDGKTTMWVTARKGGNLGKPVTIKYKVLDRRPTVTDRERERQTIEIGTALKAAELRHPDFHEYEAEMSKLMDKLPHGSMGLDEYIETIYTLAKANAGKR